MADEDGFIRVTRKSGGRRKGSRVARRGIGAAPANAIDEDDWEPYALAGIARVQAQLQADAKLVERVAAAVLESASNARRTRIDMCCLGLGAFSTSRVARSQLAFAMQLRQALAAECCEMYDPALSSRERAYLASLGWIWNELATETVRVLEADRHLVLFMPHCDPAVYASALAPLQHAPAGAFSLLGNSLAAYAERAECLAAERARPGMRAVCELAARMRSTTCDVSGGPLDEDVLNGTYLQIWNGELV